MERTNACLKLLEELQQEADRQLANERGAQAALCSAKDMMGVSSAAGTVQATRSHRPRPRPRTPPAATYDDDELGGVLTASIAMAMPHLEEEAATAQEEPATKRQRQ